MSGYYIINLIELLFFFIIIKLLNGTTIKIILPTDRRPKEDSFLFLIILEEIIN